MCLHQNNCAYHPRTKGLETIRICVICGDPHPDDTYSYKARRKIEPDDYVPLHIRLKTDQEID